MKRLICYILIFSILILYIPYMPASADSGYPLLESCSIKDNVISAGLTAKNLKTGEDVQFSYKVQEDCAVILVFFFCSYGVNSTNSGYSQLSAIANSEWINSGKIRVIAVECSNASKDKTSAFVEGCIGNNAGNFDIYYGNSNILWQYCRSFGMSSIIPPVLLISGSVGGNATILFKNEGNVNFGRLRNSLATICSDVQYDESSYLVELNVQGYELYDQLADIYNRVNEHRANNNLKPLIFSEKITRLAMQRAAECAVYYNHTRPNGDSCFTVDESGIYENSGRYLNAENIAAGQPSGADVIEAWINSPGHNANILNTSSDCIGLGAYESNGVRYWVQLFGVGEDTEIETNETRVFKTHSVNMIRTMLTDIWTYDTLITVDVCGNAELPALLTKNYSIPNWGITELMPYVDREVKDDSGRVIATIYENNGKLYVKGVASGEADIVYRAYEGDTRLVAVHIAVNAYVLPVITYGDLDNDGKVTGRDLIKLRKLLNDHTGATVTGGADANGDGTVDGLDIIAVRKYLAGYCDETGVSDYPLGPRQ